MKVVILAGGYGTRISEESKFIPKPMVKIGEMPILWHIMKEYSYYGFNDFIICLGYKGHIIKEFFSKYFLNHSDVTFDLAFNQMIIHKNNSEPWKVTLVDTGLDTMTGGRIKRIQEYIGDEPFMVTYGDGVSDVNIKEVVDFHKENKKIATITAIQPGGRFGAFDIDSNNLINNFIEKKKEDGGWVNGGYMVFEPEIFNYLEGDNTILERNPLETLAKEGNLIAYKHDGFWKCMDTLKDKTDLEDLIERKETPWIKW